MTVRSQFAVGILAVDKSSAIAERYRAERTIGDSNRCVSRSDRLP